MAIKTFNINEEVYHKYSTFCKEHGISMSKQIEIFIESQLETEPKARQGYLEKLERIRKGRFIKIKSFAEKYELNE